MGAMGARLSAAVAAGAPPVAAEGILKGKTGDYKRKDEMRMAKSMKKN